MNYLVSQGVRLDIFMDLNKCSLTNSMYLMYSLSSQSCTGVVKQYSDGSEAWTKAYSGTPAVKSLAVDSSDQYVYYGKYESILVIVKLNTVDGGFASAQSMTTLGLNHGITIHPLDSSSGYIVTSLKQNSGNPYICKFTGGSSANCQGISILSTYAYGHLKINDNQYFMIGSQSSFNHLHFLKITFGNTNIDWANKMLCSGGTCGMGVSESFISSDGNNLSCFACYGSPKYLYFVTFNLTSGNVLGTRYKSNTTCANSWSSLQTGDYIVVTVYFTAPTLILFNTAIYQFTYKQFTSNYIYQLIAEPNVGRVILSAGYSGSSYGYLTKFFVQSIQAHPDFTNSSVIMSPLAAVTDEIISESGIAILSTTIFSVQNSSFSILSSIYSKDLMNSYRSDVLYQINDLSLSFISNSNQKDNYVEIAPDLPCSSTGMVSISYSLGDYNSSNAPTWVSIDNISGLLKISIPSVSADTLFSFYINSYINGGANPVQKLVKLTILKCAAENCLLCLNQSPTVCQTCNTGFNLNSGSCVNSTVIANNETQSSSSKSLGVVIQVFSGATILIITASSTLNTSSFSSMWCVINQIQIFLLLILSGVFLPIDVKKVITGLKFALTPLDYIPFNKAQLYSDVLSNFNFETSNPTLEEIGINSDSSIINTYSIFLNIIYMVPIHLLIICLRYMAKKLNPTKKCSFAYISKWIVEKCFIIMTFGYYIRLFMEMNQLMLISSIYEINQFDTTIKLRIVSLAVAFVVLTICLLIICAFFCLSISNLQLLNNHKLSECFSGIKEKRSSRLYIFILLLRRITFVCSLICLASKSIVILIATLSFLQVCYFVYIAILRPYNQTKSNIIEINNEFFFTLCLCWLNYFESQSKWNSITTSTYVWILISNSLISFLISSVDAVRGVMIKCNNVCKINKIHIKNVEKYNTRIAQYRSQNMEKQSKKLNKIEDSKNLNINNIQEESKFSYHEEASQFKIFK